MPAVVNQTVTIVNKSGKIVSSSKHLINVLSEAKSAYGERKAEINAQRKSEQVTKQNERKALKQLESLALGDNGDIRYQRSHRSHRSSKRRDEDGRSVASRKTSQSERSPVKRGVSDSFYTDNERARRGSHQVSGSRHEDVAIRNELPRAGELKRRHTSGIELYQPFPGRPQRRASDEDIDMDLAYGDMPPSDVEEKYVDEAELQVKMSSLQRLLDEGNCLQHSVTATIDNLQKNPDALAAVAFALAEISSIASKMAPGALTAMQGSFPAVLALLASPQFAIAAGVGVGVTVIALGGYKIIKKIQASEPGRLLNAPLEVEEEEVGNAVDDQAKADKTVELIEVDEGMDSLRELSRIEKWRRGIAEEQAQSLGTSVDGEFITPLATRTLIEEGKLTEADLKSQEDSRRRRKARSEVSGKSTGRSSKASRKSKVPPPPPSLTSSSSKTKGERKKESSMLRSLFSGQSVLRKELEFERV